VAERKESPDEKHRKIVDECKKKKRIKITSVSIYDDVYQGNNEEVTVILSENDLVEH
jgi:hypothetical protein